MQSILSTQFLLSQVAQRCRYSDGSAGSGPPSTGFMDDQASRGSSSEGSARSFHVRRLLNPGDAPLKNVQVSVDEAGILTEIRSMPDSRASDALPVALIPPLINAHTHLEFSSLLKPLLPAAPFPDWIRSVIRYRNSGSSAAGAAAESISRGIRESRAAGVLAIGEITTGEVADLLPQAGGQLISFRECIGLSPERIESQLEAVQRHLTQCRVHSVRAAVSPHAPYSVHPELFDALADIAEQHQLPIAMHLAETQDEMQLLESGTGRFADFLQELGIWNDRIFPGGRSVTPLLERLARNPRALAIHGNYLNRQQLTQLAEQRGPAIVYCPRTHRYFAHDPHPWLQLSAAGVPVILGTDSRASSPDLSIWNEVQLATHQAVTAGSQFAFELVLPMVTSCPARILGLNPDDFLIRPGQPLNAVVMVDHSAQSDQPSVWAVREDTQPIIPCTL
jgi:aminodeoxyfutalosine deaminase